MATQKVFLSYARADGTAFALRLAADLQKRGFDAWIDQEDIRAGLKWDTEIEKALENCDCVLFLETEKSVVSPNVLDEVYYALEQNKKVIPLIYVDSKTPFRLQRLQHIDFTKNYETGLALLLNNLEGTARAIPDPVVEQTPLTTHRKSFLAKNTRTFALIGGLVLLSMAVVALVTRSKDAAPSETREVAAFADTTANTGMAANEGEAMATSSRKEDEKPKETIARVENKRKDQGKKALGSSAKGKAKSSETLEPEEKLDKLGELVAGDWRLLDVEPKAASQRGYLKIEALGENRATIKSYMQFYYPDSKESSYLTIFNAFAGCTSCVVTKEMKLKVEDIAVASRTIKKLEEDQPDGRKAGEVILDAGSNKSIGGTITLHFLDQNNAVIKVRQPTAVALAYEFMLEPFVYTFRFRKNE